MNILKASNSSLFFFFYVKNEGHKWVLKHLDSNELRRSSTSWLKFKDRIKNGHLVFLSKAWLKRKKSLTRVISSALLDYEPC
uniref:Uncharacterized protein n=1 Tax=Lepeophtheirus salmonis TaxID=72036 RepID=A0A0K2SYR1_LEPSM